MPEPWSQNVPAYPFYLGDYGYKEDLPEITFPTKARGAVGSGCNRWRLSVRVDTDVNQWYYSVAIGLLNGIRSSQFDEETDIYETTLSGTDDLQVGLKVQLKAPVNVAGYVMPGSDLTFPVPPLTPEETLTFVSEEFDDYKFTDLDLPNAQTAEGFAVLPIGKITYEDGAYSVTDQRLNCDVNGIFTPVNGYVVYESAL